VCGWRAGIPICGAAFRAGVAAAETLEADSHAGHPRGLGRGCRMVRRLGRALIAISAIFARHCAVSVFLGIGLSSEAHGSRSAMCEALRSNSRTGRQRRAASRSAPAAARRSLNPPTAVVAKHQLELGAHPLGRRSTPLGDLTRPRAVHEAKASPSFAATIFTPCRARVCNAPRASHTSNIGITVGVCRRHVRRQSPPRLTVGKPRRLWR
jgi:hypothetical protein